MADDKMLTLIALQATVSRPYGACKSSCTPSRGRGSKFSRYLRLADLLLLVLLEVLVLLVLGTGACKAARYRSTKKHARCRVVSARLLSCPNSNCTDVGR